MAQPAIAIILRDFDPATDYPAVVALHNDVFGMAFPVDEGVLTRRDREWAKAGNFGRWVAVAVPTDSPSASGYGLIVGHAAYMQSAAPDDDRYFVHVLVQEAWRGQGIGTQLYERLLEQMRSFGAQRLRASARVDRPADLHFFVRRGFVETFRESVSVLDVRTRDLSSYDGVVEAVEGSGIRLRSWAELKPDAAMRQAFYHLEWELLHQVRGWEDKEPPPFATWQHQRSPGRGFLPDAYRVALDGDTPVGVSFLVQRSVPGLLHQGLTGVLPAYRRRRIALALKMLNIRYAQEHGYTQIVTANAVGNAGMLHLNARLGFVAHPAWAMLVCGLA